MVLYQDSEGEPIILPSFCTLVDILGFKKMTLDAAEAGHAQKLLTEISGVLKERKRSLARTKGSPSQRTWNFRVFTDNIVFGFPHLDSQPDAEQDFGYALPIIAEHQLEMALHGFFIRGGLSYGDLHISSGIVYGEALIHAYEAESNLAVTPRILIHETARKKIHEQLDFYHVDAAPHNDLLLVDRDGHYFLNYLDLLINDYQLDKEGLSNHRLQIENKLAIHRKDQRVFEKYEWLAKYHNFFCLEFAKQILELTQETIDPFLVPDSKLPKMKLLSDGIRDDPELMKRYRGQLDGSV